MAENDFRAPESQKREAARIPVNINGSYRMGMGQEWLSCSIIDLSYGGVQFEGKFSFYQGDNVDLKFYLSEKTILCKAEITNISGRKAGARFTSLLDTDKVLINEFVHKSIFK